MSRARDTIESGPEDHGAHVLLVAAAAMQGNMEAAAQARAPLLRLNPEFSRAWISDNTPFAGELLERLLDGLRSAGVPVA